MKNKRIRRGLELTVERENCNQSNFPGRHLGRFAAKNMSKTDTLAVLGQFAVKTRRGDLWILDGFGSSILFVALGNKVYTGCKMVQIALSMPATYNVLSSRLVGAFMVQHISSFSASWFCPKISSAMATMHTKSFIHWSTGDLYTFLCIPFLNNFCGRFSRRFPLSSSSSKVYGWRKSAWR